MTREVVVGLSSHACLHALFWRTASRAYFTPHMYIYDGARSNCIGENNEDQCDTLCTNNGRYCATDPDGDLDKGISGAQVVVESLRRLCIVSVTNRLKIYVILYLTPCLVSFFLVTKSGSIMVSCCPAIRSGQFGYII